MTGTAYTCVTGYHRSSAGVHNGCGTRFCMECITQGLITQCHVCRAKLAPYSCLSCRTPIGEGEYKKLDCGADHKVCFPCYQGGRILTYKCPSEAHRYCETCYDRNCCRGMRVCGGCDKLFEETHLRLCESGAWHCEECLTRMSQWVNNQPRAGAPIGSRYACLYCYGRGCVHCTHTGHHQH
jgi:hypothetical protein